MDVVAVADAQAYARTAAEADLYEITSSHLALQRSQNLDVRAYATQMIRHHTQTTSAALAAAARDGVPPVPAVLGPEKRALIDQLSGQVGFAFDQLYVQQQIPAHEQALALHQGYASAGAAPRLRAAAARAVPLVQAHLAEARALYPRTLPDPLREAPRP
jgi:putative membrane protein